MWCKSMACKVQKLVFPYEWFDSFDKLNQPCKDITWQDFLSSLSKCDEEKAKAAYKVFVAEYIEKRGFTTMHQVLEEYNNIDVIPFIEALDKTRKLYYPDEIDMLKDAVSISGISMNYVLNKALKKSKSELYAPGGLCYQCRERENDCESCSCGGNSCELCKMNKTKIKKCMCAETAVYELLKTGIVGGPSQVFCRFHEKGVAKIRSHKYADAAKTCESVIGYDANALYLYCSGGEMPCGKEALVVNKKPYDSKRVRKFCRDVRKDKVFGFAKVNIHVPEHLYEKFQEMPPFFVVEEISEESIPESMKAYRKQTGRKKVYGNKKLLGVMRTVKILLFTPMLKWYLAHGLEVSAVHQIIEYEVDKPFEWFPEEVADARRDVDEDESKQILGDTAKLKGNSFYGKMIEDKSRHTNTRFTSDENEVDKGLRSTFFTDLEEIGGAYEISELKRSVKVDRPFQCGIAVYQLAKLRMLEFHYDFLDKYLDRRNYEVCYMDTDSEYIAFSGESLDNLAKPDMVWEYQQDKKNWLATDDYTKRTPGLFKPEFVGTRGVFLSSKCYLVQNTKGAKYSCKGISKKQNDMTYQRYLDCLLAFQKVNGGDKLQESEVDKASNAGFRVYEQGIVTYEQNELGLSAYYDKRYKTAVVAVCKQTHTSLICVKLCRARVSESFISQNAVCSALKREIA